MPGMTGRRHFIYESRAAVRLSRPELILLTLPFVFFLYPAFAMLVAKSEVPIYLNRYSWNLLLANIVNVAVYAAFGFGVVAGRLGLQSIAIFSLAVLTFIVFSSNSLLRLPAIEIIVQLARLSAGFALVVIAFQFHRSARNLLSKCCLVPGTLLGLAGLLDLSWGLVAHVLPMDKSKQLPSSYRTPYDLTNIQDQDIVLVGDSFVWGAGVRLEQRPGDILQQRLQTSSFHPRVYSLGVLGQNVQGYIQQVKDVPLTRRPKTIAVFFFANDMPPRTNLQDSLQQLAASLGHGSVVMRLGIDLFRIGITPTAEDYAALLLTHFDEQDATFSFRWQQLEKELTELFELARERAQDQPVFVLLPMLVDFEKGTFNEPLDRVGELAERIGFKVVDTMSAFRRDGRTAESYRAKPNDLHLNERGNGIVADVLFRLITKTSQPSDCRHQRVDQTKQDRSRSSGGTRCTGPTRLVSIERVSQVFAQ